MFIGVIDDQRNHSTQTVIVYKTVSKSHDFWWGKKGRVFDDILCLLKPSWASSEKRLVCLISR